MNILKVSIASVTTAILFQGLPATAQQAITPDDMPRVIDSLCMNKGVSTSAEAICEDTVVEMASKGYSFAQISHVTRNHIRYSRAGDDQARESARIYDSIMNRPPKVYRSTIPMSR